LTPRQKYSVESAKIDDTMATRVKGRAVLTVNKNPDVMAPNDNDAVVEVA
jgi:hypothetical protein